MKRVIEHTEIGTVDITLIEEPTQRGKWLYKVAILLDFETMVVAEFKELSYARDLYNCLKWAERIY